MDYKKRQALNDQIWKRLKAIGWSYKTSLTGHYTIYDDKGKERAYRGTLNAAFSVVRKEVEVIEKVNKAKSDIAEWNKKVL